MPRTCAVPKACPERGGGCECNEQTEGLHRGCSCLRQPLSQTFGLPAPRKGEPFGVVLCAKIYELTLWLEQGRLTHCRSQFSLFLPVLRFAYSSTGRAQLRTSPAARRISHGAAIFHIAKAIFHPFVRTDFTARVSALTLFLHQRFLSHLPRFRPLPCLPRQTAPFQDGTGRCAYSTHTWLCCKPPSPSGTRATPA